MKKKFIPLMFSSTLVVALISGNNGASADETGDTGVSDTSDTGTAGVVVDIRWEQLVEDYVSSETDELACVHAFQAVHSLEVLCFDRVFDVSDGTCRFSCGQFVAVEIVE